jgi:NAD(P)-dependent dehydrogenase (short-subunit alcohol dehydrogenase family)
MRYEGKAVLVTGGATGIGRATALAFAGEGAAVVIGDVNPAAQSTADDIRSAGGGAIVNTASVGAVIANPNRAAYVASKHAVAGLTKTAALEYARQGIRVNAICPGFVATDMTRPWLEDPEFLKAFLAASPIGRPAMPEEISGMVPHLCSPEAGFTNGSIIVMDGGQTSI